MTPEAQDILTQIRKLDNQADVDALVDATVDHLKDLRRRSARDVMRQLQPGDRVRVGKGLTGDAYLDVEGEVVSLQRTRVSIAFKHDKRGRETARHTVRIPASVLEPA